MNHIRTLFLTLWTLAFGGLFLVACQSPERQAAQQDFAAAYNAATADGKIDDTESADLAARWKLVQASPEGVSWETVGAAVSAIALAAVPVLRYLPNSWILGKK